MRRLACSLLVLALLTAACDDGASDTPHDTGHADAPEPDLDDQGDAEPDGDLDDSDLDDADVEPPAPDALTHLETAADFALLADADATVKYLFNADGATPRPPLIEPCTFQNTLRFPYHIMFLRSLPEFASMTFDEYTGLVLHDETRVWWGGSLQTFAATPHPVTQEPGVLIYTIYSDPGAQTAPSLEQIVEVDARAKGCAPYAAAQLVFVPADPWQQDATRLMEQALRDAGVAFLYPDQLVR